MTKTPNNSPEDWDKIIFNPRRNGKISKQLAEFYAWCKLKKRGVLAMPEGEIYTPEALKIVLQKSRQEAFDKGAKEASLLCDNAIVPIAKKNAITSVLDKLEKSLIKRRRTEKDIEWARKNVGQTEVTNFRNFNILLNDILKELQEIKKRYE